MTTLAPPSPKDRIVGNATRSVSGAPLCDPRADCQRCHRTDLQLLVVLPSVIAKTRQGALADAGYAWPRPFNVPFVGLQREATTPVARLMRPGYLYLFYPQRQRWDVWQVMQNGLTRKLMHQVDRTHYASLKPQFDGGQEPPACSRGAANLPALLIGVHGAQTTSSVWLAFSARLWTPATLQRFADNPTVDVGGRQVALRSVRGLDLNPAAVLQGQVPVIGCLPLDRSTLERHVVDFCAAEDGRWPSRDFRLAFEGTPRPPEPSRFGKAQAMEDTVRGMERALSPPAHRELFVGKTLVAMVPDAEGLADAHNVIRLGTFQARQGWMAGGPDVNGRDEDPQRPWKRQSMLHAAYIREWVRDQEREKQKTMLEGGAYRLKHVISAHEYLELQARESASGRSLHPPGTTYEKLPGHPERYRVTFPMESARQGVEGVAKGHAQGRIERYNQHLDWPAIEAANRKWLQQEEGWQQRLEAQERDHVQWLKSAALQAALAYDFDDDHAIRDGQRTAEQLREDVVEAGERIKATAICYGGGACTNVGLQFLVEQFSKNEGDRTHHIAQAMIGELGLAKIIDKSINDPGVRADLYDVVASRDALAEMQASWSRLGAEVQRSNDVLLQVADQVTSRMREAALTPSIAHQRGLQVSLQMADSKKIVWARAAGFAQFLETGVRQYLVGVRWDAKSFAAATEHTMLESLANVRERPPLTGKQTQQSVKSMRAQLRPLLAKNSAEVEVTVMLVIDEPLLRKIASRRGEKMLDVVSPGLFGSPQVVQLPESLAREVVRDYVTGNTIKALSSKSGLISFGTLFLQCWALAQSWDDLEKKGGLDQTDAVFSAVGSVAGVIGAGAELGAIALAPLEKSHLGHPAAAALVQRFSMHQLLQYGAGIMLAAGACCDAIVALVRARAREKLSDTDAQWAYMGTAGLQGSGFFAMATGAFYANQGRLAAHTMQSVVVRLASMAFNPLQLGRCLTGIGLLLWIAGVAYSFYALYLEDDDNEIFLRRSHFGTGLPQLGKFVDLAHETECFAALSIGTRGELEWHDEWGPDAFTVRIKVHKPSPELAVRAKIEGFNEINGKKVADIFDGILPTLWAGPTVGGRSNDVFSSERRFSVPAGVGAVKCTYTVHPDLGPRSLPISRGDLWIED